MMKSALVLTTLLLSQASFAQGQGVSNTPLEYNAQAEYSLYTAGPTHNIFLKIKNPGGDFKTIPLHRQAIIQNTDDNKSVYVYKGATQTYLFDTKPGIGEVDYADLKLDFKQLTGNLGCMGGFDGDSLFIDELNGTIYIQAYCGSAGYGELYIRTFEGTDWTRRLPGQNILNPKAIATSKNFYTFYVRKDNNQLMVIDSEDNKYELSDNPHDGINVIDVTKSLGTDGHTLITVKAIKNGEVKSLVLSEGADGKSLSTVSAWIN